MADNKSAKELSGASIGLREIDTEKAIAKIRRDILLTMYRRPKTGHADISAHHKELNKKIEKLWHEWYGKEWEDDTDKILSMMLLGPPGQGKTTSFKAAAQEVAEGLGLQFLMNPDDSITPGPGDFVFVSLEFSGENTITTVGGIPTKVSDGKDDDGKEIFYMKKLTNKNLAYGNMADGSVLLLDDFPNAAPNVQNVGLSLTDEKRFQGQDLTNMYIGATGNLGALDGTHTTRLSTALRGRVETYYTEDKMPNWVMRAQKRWKDRLGTCGVDSYLKREHQEFAQMPDTKKSGGFQSPRTWDHLTIELRRAMRTAKNPTNLLNTVDELASSIIGMEGGKKFHAYYYTMMMGADPLAKKMIQEGVFDKKAFEEKFGDGYSAEQQTFAAQYATALADYAIAELVSNKNRSLEEINKNPELRKTIERFAVGIMPVNQDTFSFCLDHFKGKLANQVPEWSSQLDTRSVLTTEAKKVFARIIADNPDVTDEMKGLMMDTLSDMNKFDGGGRAKRTRRS